MLQTAMPSAFAASRSTLFVPVAVNPTNRSPGTARMRAPVIASLLVRMNSQPAMRASTSASVDVECNAMPGNTPSSFEVSRSS
jgi:hypothetical protein